ncbi:g10794 [Coccomyxa elongata]
MASEEMHALPEADPKLAGESVETGKGDRYHIKVSNAKGYLCHIHMESKYDCPPEWLFAIFTNPDNTGVFRDIKKRGKRKVLELDPAGRKIVEVEQIGEAKVLFKSREFTTLLKVDEDARNPEELRTAFTLIRSDILSRFNGCWSLAPIRNKEGTEVIGTAATLEQDILPAGAPAFLKHVPLVGGALRGICVRAVKRMVEDLDTVLDKVRTGTPLEDILQPPQPVASHVLDDFSDGEDADVSETPASGHTAGIPEKHDASSSGATEAKAAGLKSASAPAHGQQDAHRDGGGHEGGAFWDRQSWPSPTKQREGHVP